MKIREAKLNMQKNELIDNDIVNKYITQSTENFNKQLQKNYEGTKIFENGKNNLTIKFTAQILVLLFFSVCLTPFIYIFIDIHFCDFFSNLFTHLDNIIFTTKEANDIINNTYLRMFIDCSITASLIFIVLKKLNVSYSELRFIDNKLDIIKGNKINTITLSNDIKFILKEKYYNENIIGYTLHINNYNLNEEIYYFNSKMGANLILGKINNYLKDNTKNI